MVYFLRVSDHRAVRIRLGDGNPVRIIVRSNGGEQR
jgi:hypothetical protein